MKLHHNNSSKCILTPASCIKPSIVHEEKMILHGEHLELCRPGINFTQGKIKVDEKPDGRIPSLNDTNAKYIPQAPLNFTVKQNAGGGQCLYLSISQGAYKIMAAVDPDLRDWPLQTIELAIYLIALTLKRETINTIYFILHGSKNPQGRSQEHRLNFSSMILSSFEVPTIR